MNTKLQHKSYCVHTHSENVAPRHHSDDEVQHSQNLPKHTEWQLGVGRSFASMILLNFILVRNMTFFRGHDMLETAYEHKMKSQSELQDKNS